MKTRHFSFFIRISGSFEYTYSLSGGLDTESKEHVILV